MTLREPLSRWIVVVLALGAAAAMCILFSVQRSALVPPPLMPFPSLTAGDRVLILAPHEDDETLAAGGLIQRARSVGAKVRVAYLTYGDHNQLAVMVYRMRPWLTPKINRGMGEVRRGEATRAMSFLGVPPQQLTFLGYPDNDTFDIWRFHWGSAPPLHSVLTNTVRVPYRDALGFGKPYKGEEITAGVAGVLREFRPTLVFVSHPADGNPDHRALYLYLRLALLDLDGEIPPPRVYTYPVHMGPWPWPHRYHPDEWLSFPGRLEAETCRAVLFVLTPEEVRRKYEAIRMYRSQMSDSGYWMTAFARRNELFILDPAPLPLGRYWSERQKAMANASTIAYEVEYQMGHVGGVAYRGTPGGMCVRVDLLRRMERALGLSVSLFGYRRGTPFAEMPKLNIDWLFGKLRVSDGRRVIATGGVKVEDAAGRVLFTVPWEMLGKPDAVFAHVRGMIGSADRSYTGWEEFTVSRASAATPGKR